MHRFRLVVTTSVISILIVLRPEPAMAQTKLTIGYAAVSPRTTPLYLAQERPLVKRGGQGWFRLL